MKNRQRE